MVGSVALVFAVNFEVIVRRTTEQHILALGIEVLCDIQPVVTDVFDVKTAPLEDTVVDVHLLLPQFNAAETEPAHRED